MKHFTGVLLAFSLVVVCGCDDKYSIPANEEESVQTLASRLPADSSAVAVFSDYKRLKQEVGSLTRLTRIFYPTLAPQIPQILQANLDFNPLKLSAWEKASFHPKGSIAVGLVNQHPVVLGYVKKSESFNSRLTTDKDGDSADFTPGKEGDIAFKSLKFNETQKLAWNFDKNIVRLVFPQIGSQLTPGQDKTSTEVLVRISRTPPKNSVFQKQEYKKFRERYPSNESSEIFLNTSSIRPQKLGELFYPNLSPVIKKSISLSLRHAKSAGVELSSKPKTLGVSIWLNFPEEIVPAVKKVLTAEAKAPWAKFIEKDIMMGFRGSLNWGALWPKIKELSLYQKKIKPKLRSWEEGTPIDFEEKILSKLTGHLAGFLFGVRESILMKTLKKAQESKAQNQRPEDEKIGSMIGTLFGLLFSIELGGGVEFQNGADPQSTLRTFAESKKEKIGLAKTKILKLLPMETEDGKKYSDITFIRPTGFMRVNPLRGYLYGNLGFIGITGLREKRLAKAFHGDVAKEARITHSESLPLGRKFARQKSLNGFYLNSKPIYKLLKTIQNVKNKSPDQLMSISTFFKRTKETLFTIDSASGGASVTLQVKLPQKRIN